MTDPIVERGTSGERREDISHLPLPVYRTTSILTPSGDLGPGSRKYLIDSDVEGGILSASSHSDEGSRPGATKPRLSWLCTESTHQEAPRLSSARFGVKEFLIVTALLYACLTVLLGVALILSYAAVLEDSNGWHPLLVALTFLWAVSAWCVSHSPSTSTRLLKLLLAVSYSSIALTTCLAYHRTPAKAGQLQTLLAMLLAFMDDKTLRLVTIAVTAASWGLGLAAYPSGYDLEGCLTPGIISLLAHFAPLVYPYFHPGQNFADDTGWLCCGVSAVKVLAEIEQPPAPQQQEMEGQANNTLTVQHISRSSGQRGSSELFESAEQQAVSSIMSCPVGPPRKKPSATSSDAAFFVAPPETINCRLSAVCRASVDGLIHRSSDDDVGNTEGPSLGLRRTSTASTLSKQTPPGSQFDPNSPPPGVPPGPPPGLPLGASTRPPLPVTRPATADAPPSERQEPPEKTQRSFSVSSDRVSIMSSGTSYVSFTPTLKRGFNGGGTSFCSPTHNQKPSSDGQIIVSEMEETDETDTANLFETSTASSNSLTSLATGSPKRKKPSMFVRHSFAQRAPRRPDLTVQVNSNKSVASVASPTSSSIAGKSVEETKKDATETMEIVKSVVQLDFTTGAGAPPQQPSSHLAPGNMKIPFQNLPQTTLQKLVVLFTRLSEELDTFRIQRFICACIVQVVQCEKASIFLCDWKRQQIWTISDEGHEIRVPMAGSLAGYAALHNRVLNIRDAYSDARFNKEVDRNTGYVTRNLLVYPITRGFGYLPTREDENVIAVVEAINKEDDVFSTEDEGILALLGKQAGIHLANAQIYQQLQYEGNKTQSLLEVSKEINDVQLDLGAMMSKIMSRARQVLTVDRASIFLVDDQKGELWSILTDSETAAQLGDNVIRLPVGVGLAGHVAMTGQVLNIPDAYACDLFNPEFDRKTGFVTKATLCVPVKPQHANKVMGVIQFINKCNGEAFHEGDVELALSFSSFVGISLNNILLYDELREGQFIREKNKELVRLRDQAKQAAEAKSNFLMAMSHEIRTPMSGVIGMCELLMNTSLSTEQQEMADTIRSCGEALMAIINDVLDYGRLDAGKLELEQRSFGLISILEDTIDVIRPKTEVKGITLMIDIDPVIVTDVVGDVYRLRQVLTNLLGNAVKFTPYGGDISLLVRSREDLSDDGQATLYFSVTDTGIGIEASAQQKLFRPFEQADAGTTRQYGGSGLGLAICKQLVEAMNGDIGIESAPGKGSTFWFTASFKRDPVCNTSVTAWLNVIAGQHSNKTVLFACSHAVHRGVLLRLLSVVQCSTWFVTSFTELMSVLESLPADAQYGTGTPGTSTRAPKQLPYLPHVVIVDEDVTDLNEQGLQLLGMLSRRQKCKINLLMSMARKTALQGKEDFHSILTKPPKLALVASIFSVDKNSAAAAGSRQSESSPERMVPAAKKVLVAEDNLTNQLLIKKQLAGFGITPRICGNGQEAVDALTQERYELVFMDCHMPVLDGYGAVEKIRKLEKEGTISKGMPPVVVVALTADALPHTRGQCVEAGMNDYVTKPLRKATLKTILDKYLFSEADLVKAIEGPNTCNKDIE